MKPRSFSNTTDEDELVNSDDEDEPPDFVSHKTSGTDDDGQIQIQSLIDNLNLGLSDTDEVEDIQVGLVISLHDLEAQPVLLDNKPTGNSQNIFEKVGDLGTDNFADAPECEDLMVPVNHTTSFTVPTTQPCPTRSGSAAASTINFPLHHTIPSSFTIPTTPPHLTHSGSAAASAVNLLVVVGHCGAWQLRV